MLSMASLLPQRRIDLGGAHARFLQVAAKSHERVFARMPTFTC
jgi:hypothetical protein